MVIANENKLSNSMPEGSFGNYSRERKFPGEGKFPVMYASTTNHICVNDGRDLMRAFAVMAGRDGEGAAVLRRTVRNQNGQESIVAASYQPAERVTPDTGTVMTGYRAVISFSTCGARRPARWPVTTEYVNVTVASYQMVRTSIRGETRSAASVPPARVHPATPAN